jgi:hypothetical protein
VKRYGEKHFRVQADLKRDNEECSGNKFALKRDNEKCFTMYMLKTSYTGSVLATTKMYFKCRSHKS